MSSLVGLNFNRVRCMVSENKFKKHKMLCYVVVVGKLPIKGNFNTVESRFSAKKC